MRIELKEVERIGRGRDSTVTYDILVSGRSIGCEIIADKDHSYMVKGDHPDTFSLEEMEAITFEMRKRTFKILTGGIG